MIEHVTTFTPADGSAPRTITLRIGDLRPDPDGDWTVAAEVLGFERDVRTRLKQVDWPLAVRDAARFVADIVTGFAENSGGGTLNPLVYPPNPLEKTKKKKRKAKKRD